MFKVKILSLVLNLVIYRALYKSTGTQCGYQSITYCNVSGIIAIFSQTSHHHYLNGVVRKYYYSMWLSFLKVFTTLLIFNKITTYFLSRVVHKIALVSWFKYVQLSYSLLVEKGNRKCCEKRVFNADLAWGNGRCWKGE